MMRNFVFKNWIQLSAALSALLVLGGCSGGHDHDHDHDHGHGHAHHAPHGGALTMLGNHAYQLELLTAPESKQVKLYVLDGGAENFVRISSESLEGVATFGGQTWNLTFKAVANTATGETVGDTSYFVAESEVVSKLAKFDLGFDQLSIRGKVFESVKLPFPEGAH
ncbi:hypothetical protein [Pelagicoccus mobilis]|uniref:Uncharacterized protein n=1 Tax=Pelagicoccus mobilis TaxID=415221 RepID=A0A934S395_9BACT|nr:hypothetical protein [Pelagicoccus mobilis]MBK1880289.1 hypothetical protein [Pelagicoccus mobilis]